MANQTDAFKGSPIQAKNENSFWGIHKACMGFMEASLDIKFEITVAIDYFLDQTNHILLNDFFVSVFSFL